ncbi:MAG: DNA translocase FtsK [Acidobacteriota bacterium]|nr:DNA translocase FtsK [Acidobacteriota bacterium]
MRLTSPAASKRLNEVTGFLFLALGLLFLLSLASYRVVDPSWDTAAGNASTLNLTGPVGAHVADLFVQAFGAAAFLLPCFAFAVGWKWMRSEPVEAPIVKLVGFVLFVASFCAGAALGPDWRIFQKSIPVGGAAGFVLADDLRRAFNYAGAAIVTTTALIVSIYLLTTFTISKLAEWAAPPIAWLRRAIERWRDWRRQVLARRQLKREQKLDAAHLRAEARLDVLKTKSAAAPSPVASPAQHVEEEEHEIPICQLDDLPFAPDPVPAAVSFHSAPEPPAPVRLVVDEPKPHTIFRLPSTELLNEIPGRSAFDEQELKATAAQVKAKFQEFNVLGSVVQINPGPVVTTFEFKPEAGIKYSRITSLTEDLCLGLQAESILIERIPGKPTVGIEVPNSRRELISLRQVLESDEFQSSQSRLTISMGKDINGRIKVAALDVMPHLLIAGSTGSGKSVMINSLVMSVLYKSTPDEVRMILVDPKRVELGMYEGIPHLLTPVITDPRKATNALKNAVLEMERRLRLLAEHGVRNIEQFNKKLLKLQQQPRKLFDEDDVTPVDELRPLPFILILIDELADLMMLEGRNVEESVIRLAQMARAVGMHLVLATQRPSVDVITGIIKANFPARISFRVATRVDSRTILDVMGSEHLLGKGDMLFLPPGSSRLTRVHGAFVTETEINGVVDFWKAQARPEYDQTFLIAPPADEGEPEPEEAAGDQDPMYEEALRVVLEMGKASTSTLQRRLRLGYGRAARILDMMHRDGIIGPPDGSKPREVLKRPEWLREVEKA